MLDHEDGEDRPGPPSCRTMRKICGPVTSCRSQTSSFAHCLLSSFSMCNLGESCMWVSLDLRPTPGPPNNSERRLLMDNRRTISFVIVIPSLDPVSRVWPQPAASRCSPHLTTHSEPLRSVNGFWGVSVESVSITCSSCRRSSWTVSFTPLSSTSIEPGRIKASNNRSQNSMVSLLEQITMVARFSPCQSWVDYTTIIAEVLEL